ncbi:MAG: hypothetical protein LBL66_03815 [Clostridiales bacterium]|jgi:hypothetical protein|nr:hypothetical protein [Clostridiales bacterium]
MNSTTTNYKPDYGMLAYLKAEDLAKRIDSIAKKAYIGTPPRCTPLKFSRRLDKQLTAYDTLPIKPLKARSGAQGFTVWLKVRIANGTETEPDAMIGLSSAANGAYISETVKILKGAHDYMLLGCGLADEKSGSVTLVVAGAQGRTLVSFDLVFIGNDLMLEPRKSLLKILAQEDGGSAVAYMAGKRAYYTLDLVNTAYYDGADEFMALGGGLYIRRLGREIAILNAAFAEKYAVSGNSAAFAALYHAPEQAYYITYIENGAAYFREFTPDYMTAPVPVRLPFAAAGCGAVSGAPVPAFLYRDQKGADYLKTAKTVTPEPAQTVAVNIELEAFEI